MWGEAQEAQAALRGAGANQGWTGAAWRLSSGASTQRLKTPPMTLLAGETLRCVAHAMGGWAQSHLDLVMGRGE